MRLIMTLVVRNEADIIRQNVAFHLEQGVDFIIVTDNGSVDGTRDILEEFSRTGLVRVIDESDGDRSRGQWFSRMALLAREEHAADWILNTDADEFWYPSSGDLKSALAETPAEANIVFCQRQHMLCPNNRAPQGPWYRELVYRVTRPVLPPTLRAQLTDPAPVPYFYLDVPPKSACRARGLKAVHTGNHWADYETEPRPASGSIHVYRFPVRSFAQFVAKVRGAGAGYARDEALDSSVDWHKRRWYKMLVEGDIERAFREALPSERQLVADLRNGMVVIDWTIGDGLGRLSSDSPTTRLGRTATASSVSGGAKGREPMSGTAVCVLGMYRSDTSALARALNLLGVDLGRPHHLTPPDEESPEGCWEHREFVRINDAILERFGGARKRPPVFPPGWERSESLADLRETARDLLRARFAQVALWGWNDPRTCLTLPFWQSLLPPMRYVVSLRNPLSVRWSLEDRDGLSMEESGRLWLAHVTAALIHTEGCARLLVSYERLLAAYEPEVRRLAEFIDRLAALTPEMRGAFDAGFRPEPCHHDESLGRTLETAALPFSARALYALLCVSVPQDAENSDAEASLDTALTALARASREADTRDVARRQPEGAHRKLRQPMVRVDGHPLRRGCLRLWRAVVPPDSRRESILKDAWQRLRRPGES